MGRYMEDLITRKIQEIQQENNVYQVGRVTSVKEYIVEISGLDEAAFMERVKIGSSAVGYISAIRRNSVVAAVTEGAETILVGDEAVATGEQFGALYSPDSIGHVIDMFGRDRMADAVFERVMQIPVERPTIPIMDRRAVVRPMETGIAGIDLIYPIGRGQRQLILGDKKTGKTQICLDAIVNQNDNDTLCIYTAIGKTKKDVRDVYHLSLIHI